MASYALMSMNGSPVEIKFNVDVIPAKGRNVFIEAELVDGEGVTPFSTHSTIVVIDNNIEASIVGQTANVKIYPRDEQAHSIVVGQRYPVKLKNNGGTDGICVLATGKNYINGANVGNWQAALERVKTYVEKYISLVEPKESPRFIVLPIWADNKPGWGKGVHPYRHQLKDQFNNWLREKYGKMCMTLRLICCQSRFGRIRVFPPTKPINRDNGTELCRYPCLMTAVRISCRQ